MSSTVYFIIMCTNPWGNRINLFKIGINIQVIRPNNGVWIFDSEHLLFAHFRYIKVEWINRNFPQSYNRAASLIQFNGYIFFFRNWEDLFWNPTPLLPNPLLSYNFWIFAIAYKLDFSCRMEKKSMNQLYLFGGFPFSSNCIKTNCTIC